jgi:hypothetical protein
MRIPDDSNAADMGGSVTRQTVALQPRNRSST